jgi:capsid portal protein
MEIMDIGNEYLEQIRDIVQKAMKDDRIEVEYVGETYHEEPIRNDEYCSLVFECRIVFKLKGV